MLPPENIMHKQHWCHTSKPITHKQQFYPKHLRITYWWYLIPTYSTSKNTQHQKYQNSTHASNATIKNMEAACANLYYVDPAKVKYCFEQGFSLGLSLDDCGYRFVAKCRNISNSLKAFAYVYSIPCKNAIFSTLRSIQQTCITFKGAITHTFQRCQWHQREWAHARTRQQEHKQERRKKWGTR